MSFGSNPFSIFKSSNIKGLMKLDRRLRHLEKRGARRVAGKGVRAGLMVVGKAMRSAINASDASSELKREARKTIGQRFQRKMAGGLGPSAKVGFSVAKRAKQVAQASAARGKRLGQTKGSKGEFFRGTGDTRGVGISATNVHWFVLGTTERKHQSGHATGKIDGVFGDVTHQALATSQGAALEAARAKISAEIKREALKGA